jgi:hypothetical protein
MCPKMREKEKNRNVLMKENVGNLSGVDFEAECGTQRNVQLPPNRILRR